MAYSSWSVVFGEQPSAAKWNILGTNDASFNDGSGIANDAITDTKLVYGKLRTRQGGSATNWGTSGVTAYDYSATNVFMQCGTRSSDSGSDVTLTFPTAFNQVPVIVMTPSTAASANCYPIIITKSATQCTFRCIDSGGTQRSEEVYWIAIGE